MMSTIWSLLPRSTNDEEAGRFGISALKSLLLRQPSLLQMLPEQLRVISIPQIRRQGGIGKRCALVSTLRLIGLMVSVVVLSTPADIVAGTQPRITFPASRVSIDPADGYSLSSTGTALENWSLSTWLSIDESSTRGDSALGLWMDPEILAVRELTRVGMSNGIVLDNRPGTKFVFERSVGHLVKHTFYLQVIVVGDSINSLTVIAAYPDTLREALKNQLLGMVQTIRWDRSKALDPMELIGFTISPSPPFAQAKCSNGTVFYTPGGIPPDSVHSFAMFTVGTTSSGRAAITETLQKELVDEILGTVEPYVHISSLVEVNEVTFDGTKGYETVAAARAGDSAVTVYVALLFHPAGRVVFFGISGEQNLDENLTAFRAMARTYKRKRITSGDANPCKKFMDMAQYAEAAKCFDNVLQGDPKDLPSLLGKADALRLLGMQDEALGVYNQILGDNESSEEAFAGCARALYALHQDRLAIHAFDAALALNSDNTDLLVERAEAKARYGNMPGSETDFRNAMKRVPPSAKLNRELGDVLAATGPSDSAIAAYTRAVTLDSLDTRSLAARGRIYFTRGNYRPAYIDFSASLRLDANQWEIQFSRASIELSFGKIEDAIRDLDVVLESRPREKRTLAMKGCAETALSRSQEAMGDFEAALKVDTNLREAYLGRGISYLGEDNFKAAAPDLRAAVQLYSTPESRLLLYAAEFRVYNEDLAREHLRKYYDIMKWYTPTQRAAIRYALGDVDEDQLLSAADSLENVQARKADQLCDVYFTLALLDCAKGMKINARKQIEKCLATEGYGSSFYQYARMLMADLEKNSAK